MNRTLTPLLLMLAASTAAPAVICPDIDGFDHEDKVDHVAVGVAIGWLAAEIAEEIDAPRWVQRVVAYAPVVLAGVGKELLDAQDRDNHTPDPLDAVATIIGGTIAIELTFRW